MLRLLQRSSAVFMLFSIFDFVVGINYDEGSSRDGH